MTLNLNDFNHLPEVYAQENVSDPIVYEHITTTGTTYHAYLTEYSDRAPDGYPHLAFGYIDAGEPELGYVSMDELMEVRGPYGLGAVRDPQWKPMPLSEARQHHERQQEALREQLLEVQPELDIDNGGGIGL